ncbi:hypothetical protein OQJ15_02160 [Fluoribacter dumoffii]|uniref:hypothetical protein n=1 Tax=Fluoribacter dumoffii TaxID=463 RepID=UPI0022442F61|nr:hypothetical protein [Fluoribacter dumoffii]MCW8385102.1 hypothetical protein [Fluoribacter dumoffii]MCW8496600.1 hypothetical protein [Fluoribacter dumoffii]
MKEKYPLIESTESSSLPTEMWVNVTNKLSKLDLFNFYRSSKEQKELLQYELDKATFLDFVVRGDYHSVRAALERNIRLLFHRNEVTDCSGRTFFAISGFEYALWAFDKHMWTLIIECIPANEEGKEILELLLDQYNRLRQQGVSYSLNGQITTGETHFDLESTLIHQLQLQVNYYRRVGGFLANWDSSNHINKLFVEGVGGAQKLLPMCIAKAYCSSEPFSPSPKFEDRVDCKPQFYCYFTEEKYLDWYGKDSGLGSEVAICKGFKNGAESFRAGTPVAKAELLEMDLAAMQTFLALRTKELLNLEAQLAERQEAHLKPMMGG